MQIVICYASRVIAMIELLLYGDIRKLVRDRIPDANTILLFEHVEGEHFQSLLSRLGLKPDDVGDCYINNNPAMPDNVIHNGDTIELNQSKSS